MGGETNAFGEQENGGTEPLAQGDPKPAPGKTPEDKQPVVQKPDYESKRDFGKAAQKFGYGTNDRVKPNDTLGGFLKSVLGVQNLNNIKGLKSKVDGFVTLSNSDAELQKNVMTDKMLGVLSLGSARKPKDATVTMDGLDGNDAGLKITMGAWDALDIKKGGGTFKNDNNQAVKLDPTGDVDAILKILLNTPAFTDFFKGFADVGLLVGDELKSVGLDEFDARNFKDDMWKRLNDKRLVKDDGKLKRPAPLESLIQEYVNENWVKPLFDNIKKYVEGDKPVNVMVVDLPAGIPNVKSTFDDGSNVTEGMKFSDATNTGVLNLVRIKKGENTIFEFDAKNFKTGANITGNNVKALAPQVKASADNAGTLKFADILADSKGVETLEYAQELLGKTPKVKGGTVDQAKFIAKLDELLSGHRAVKKAKNAKNDKDRKAAEKELEKDFAKIVGALAERAYTESKGPGRFDTKVEEGAIG